jgi:hypothetical protein
MRSTTPAPAPAPERRSTLRRHTAAGVIAQYIHELAQPEPDVVTAAA